MEVNSGEEKGREASLRATAQKYIYICLDALDVDGLD